MERRKFFKGLGGLLALAGAGKLAAETIKPEEKQSTAKDFAEQVDYPKGVKYPKKPVESTEEVDRSFVGDVLDYPNTARVVGGEDLGGGVSNQAYAVFDYEEAISRQGGDVVVINNQDSHVKDLRLIDWHDGTKDIHIGDMAPFETVEVNIKTGKIVDRYVG